MGSPRFRIPAPSRHLTFSVPIVSEIILWFSQTYRQAPWLPISLFRRVRWLPFRNLSPYPGQRSSLRRKLVMTLSQEGCFGFPQREVLFVVFISSVLLSFSEPDCPSTKGSSPYIYTKSILLIVTTNFYIRYLSDLLITSIRNRS